MENIKNNKGGVKLCYEGYRYTVKSKGVHTIRWECAERSGQVCNGKITSTFDRKDIIPGSLIAHSHEPSDTTTDIQKTRMEMKENAKTKKAKTNQLYSEAMQSATEGVRAGIGKSETVKRDIRRQKRGVRPKEPKCLSEISFEDSEFWTTTGEAEPKPFLIHDSGPDAADRILVFASEEGLRLLARSHQWHMDGNFKMAPKFSKQVYVIRVPFGESAVSCVYAILPGKKQTIYEELFDAIISKVDNLGFDVDPKTIITDYEMAVIQATENKFGKEVQTQGCYYHLTQSTWRKIQDLGLVELYRSRESIRQFCGMLDGLALLAVSDVAAGMQLLKDKIPAGLDDLVTYFDATYVSGSYKKIKVPAHDGRVVIKLRRTPPLFPPVVWNVHQATLNDGDRTNNICEGWNNGFMQLVGQQHPSIWFLIEGFQQDHAVVMTALAQDRIGERLQRKKPKRAVKTFNARLKNLCQDRANDTKSIEEFLAGVGDCIRFK